MLVPKLYQQGSTHSELYRDAKNHGDRKHPGREKRRWRRTQILFIFLQKSDKVAGIQILLERETAPIDKYKWQTLARNHSP